ncbi:MAG TPA: methyl-accepting chemotaxis protein [Gemmatimonadaceae bacterium]
MSSLTPLRLQALRGSLEHTLQRTGETIQRRIVAAIGAIALIGVVGLTWAGTSWIAWLLAGQPLERVRGAQTVVLLGAVVLLVLVLFALSAVGRFVARHVTEPAAALAAVSERVASGDLLVQIGRTTADDDLGRLSRATEMMVSELRRLVSVMRDSARETAAMSAEITAGTEQMRTAASEMAHTSGELSSQSTDMAQTIQSAAEDATRLKAIVERVAEGTREGVTRNARIRTLALENRGRLDASSTALEQLAAEARANAEAATALATASEEIRAFVYLVRKIARQSKLLALNASMEAARAGEQGEGFAVVASEIRKLAANSTNAAERTEQIVNDVLLRVEESRASSQRTVETVANVQAATQSAVNSFTLVEHAVIEAESWTTSIEQAAADSSALIGETTSRLDELARGTESFAAAMQQVAASAEQQSASTEEIAAAAGALAEAARRVWQLVSAFRLDENRAGAAPESAQRAAPAA